VNLKVTMKPIVETFQTQFEFDQLLAIVEDMMPARILEIGSWEGGTLWHWLQIATEHVVAVDDRMSAPHLWDAWAAESSASLTLLQGRSQDPAVVGRAARLCPYDLVFIDGDHTFDAVLADWDNYSTMVAPGGIVALHDILERPGYGVDRVWADIKNKPGTRTVEITVSPNEDPSERNGIGVVWL
jgi:cephalosporin hydroxylase